MKKLSLIIATALSVGLLAPTLANAETVVVKHRDHGWHHHGHKTVIIKKGHHHD